MGDCCRKPSSASLPASETSQTLYKVHKGRGKDEAVEQPYT